MCHSFHWDSEKILAHSWKILHSIEESFELSSEFPQKIEITIVDLYYFNKEKTLNYLRIQIKSQNYFNSIEELQRDKVKLRRIKQCSSKQINKKIIMYNAVKQNAFGIQRGKIFHTLIIIFTFQSTEVERRMEVNSLKFIYILEDKRYLSSKKS